MKMYLAMLWMCDTSDTSGHPDLRKYQQKMLFYQKQVAGCSPTLTLKMSFNEGETTGKRRSLIKP